MEKQRESVANYRILTHSWAINQNFELCQNSTSEPKATGLTTDRWILCKDEKVDILWRGREIYGQSESNAADEQPWQIWETGLFLLINVKYPAWLHLRPPAATVVASKFTATVKNPGNKSFINRTPFQLQYAFHSVAYCLYSFSTV